MLPCLSKVTSEKFCSDFKFAVSIGLSYRWQSHDSDITTFSSGFLKFLFRVSQAKNILEGQRLLLTILNSRVLLMLLLMKEPIPKPQRVKSKQKWKKIIH